MKDGHSTWHILAFVDAIHTLKLIDEKGRYDSVQIMSAHNTIESLSGGFKKIGTSMKNLNLISEEDALFFTKYCSVSF